MELGFMQGRLSNVIDGKIQAFPWQEWEAEFATANQIGLRLMEWTLDHDGLSINPLLTAAGQRKIQTLSKKHDVLVTSVTGDCFMQRPFFKESGQSRQKLVDELVSVIEACGQLNITKIVFPLVDDGSISNSKQQASLISEFLLLTNFLESNNVQIAFESDYGAYELKAFIDQFPKSVFGINYDIGNSASLGYSVTEEINSYADRIINIHLKDRLYNGSTVPLGMGNADFIEAFKLLKEAGYKGNFILQTARATDNDHVGAMKGYVKLVNSWWMEDGP